MMKKLNALNVGLLATTLLITGCNTTGISSQHPAETALQTNTKYPNVKVFNKRTELPKGTKVLGVVKAQNKFPNGSKASPQEILDELKRQAVLLGGNGMVFITPAAVQTKANAVLVPTL